MKANNWIFLALGAVILVALFFLFKPKSSSENIVSTPSPTSNSVASSSAMINGKVFELVVKEKKLISGPETIQVMEGDEVTIRITVDEDEELHLHGYDKSIDLTANQPAELKLTSNLTGRFPYELEDSKTEIGALEVQPK